MIENIALLLFLWGLIIGAFIVGLFWNAHAYDRGYADGFRSAYRQWGPKYARFIYYGDDTAGSQRLL